MTKLDVYLKNELIESVELQQQPVSIGRKPDNGLVLHDRTVSRHHAQISYVAEGKYWQVENLSSTNPVRLNGDVVARPEILFDGDHLAIGAYTLVVK